MRSVGRLGVVLALAVALVVPAAPAFAATTPASGTFEEGPVENERFLGVVGGAEVYSLDRDVWFSGTYEGTARAHQTIAIREDGGALLHITIRFNGTACGKPARLVFQVVGHGNLFEGELRGHYAVFDRGRLVGSGSFTGVPNVGGEYEGRARCG
jgi:hypothetical protein